MVCWFHGFASFFGRVAEGLRVRVGQGVYSWYYTKIDITEYLGSLYIISTFFDAIRDCPKYSVTSILA
jgi:hypothetical protein